MLRQDPELADAHRRLLPALSLAQPVPAIGPDQAPVLPAEPLSDREREVLRTSRAFRAADRLTMNFSYTSSAPQSIYRKLAAAHRGEAVRRARQLELI